VALAVMVRWLELMSKCSCGRAWDHCKRCGSRNVYRMQTASMEQGVDIWKCKKCMKPSSELDKCQAPGNRELREFKSKERAEKELVGLSPVDRLNKMAQDGASMEELEIAAESLGVTLQKEDKSPPKVEEIPEGWSRDENGQLVPPISSDDLFEIMKKRARERDEEDAKNKNSNS
jgi:predicted nucleic-acid-binding Zn-ribbon protein